jgi:hypothetical protein
VRVRDRIEFWKVISGLESKLYSEEKVRSPNRYGASDPAGCSQLETDGRFLPYLVFEGGPL